MNYLLLIIGFILLIKGADFFVDGAVAIAKKFKIPSVVIGMTIIAIGTSLPEITISAFASMKGNNGVAVGNVLGSNVLNICLILSIVAIIKSVPVDRSILKMDFIILFLSEIALLCFGLINDNLTRLEGVLLLSLFIAFIVMQIYRSKNAKSSDDDNYKQLHPLFIIVYLIGGCVAIKFGGDFVVDSASAIAKQFGMSDNLIGLTIVAFGTSLPELVTSIVAARKNEVDMALGNVIGSNIVNIVLALSLTSIIAVTPYSVENIIDTVAVIVVSIVTFIFSYTDKEIKRNEGIILLVFYSIYFIYLFIR